MDFLNRVRQWTAFHPRRLTLPSAKVAMPHINTGMSIYSPAVAAKTIPNKWVPLSVVSSTLNMPALVVELALIDCGFIKDGTPTKEAVRAGVVLSTRSDALWEPTRTQWAITEFLPSRKDFELA